MKIKNAIKRGNGNNIITTNLYFCDITFPKFMKGFAISKPEFVSIIIPTSSGKEIRRSKQEYPRQKYILRDCRLSKEQFAEFNNFFKYVMGRFKSFRFRDEEDYLVQNQVLERSSFNESSNNSCYFNLVKSYIIYRHHFVRKITKPSTKNFKLYIDGAETDNFNLDCDQGIVHICEKVPEKSVVSADFEFDVKVRFDQDGFDYKSYEDGSVLFDVTLVETF